MMPKIWRDLDQESLDNAYDQTVYAPNYGQVVRRMVENSAALFAHTADVKTLSYGDSAIEVLHYFPPARRGAPIHVHVHGGAWRQRLAEGVAFPAEMFVRAGIGFAVFDFISVDETGGDLKPMGRQVEKALAWIARHAGDLGGDPARLHLSGFSSGAHLAAVALTADWRAEGFDAVPYRSALLISGMYDLEPVRLSKRSEYVTIDDAVAQSMSAQRNIDAIEIPITLAYGTLETPEFQRQTREFADHLAIAGKRSELIVCEGYNHYEMMEALGHPYSPLGRAALAHAVG